MSAAAAAAAADDDDDDATWDGTSGSAAEGGGKRRVAPAPGVGCCVGRGWDGNGAGRSVRVCRVDSGGTGGPASVGIWAGGPHDPDDGEDFDPPVAAERARTWLELYVQVYGRAAPLPTLPTHLFVD